MVTELNEPMDRKRSIRVQIVLVILFSCFITVLLAYLMNNFFLKHVYQREKIGNMVTAFRELKKESADGSLYETDNTSLEKICSENNVDIIIMSSDGSPLVSSEAAKDRMLLRFYNILFASSESKTDSILISGKNFSIERSKDERLNTEDLILWGTLSDGNLILMQTGIGPIEEAAKISNHMLFYTGLLSIVLSLIMAMILGRRLTRPILELSLISKKMAGLDFEAKYRPRKYINEVDELGINMNHMSETLEKTIIELKQTNLELKQDLYAVTESEKRRKEFLSNVSHELKTPIALIQGYAEGLCDGVSDNPEDQKYYSEVIIDEAQKMNRLVQELMHLDQLEGGKMDVSMERFDIMDLIRSVVEKSRPILTGQGIQVRIVADEKVFCIADPFYTEQVFTNYFSNAVHYVKGDEKLITISVTKREDAVRIAVKNTGDPIPEEAVPHLFEKFYKVDKARSREYGGSGIGLSVVKAIMTLFHRDFGEENLPDGVSFWFELDKG